MRKVFVKKCKILVFVAIVIALITTYCLLNVDQFHKNIQHLRLDKRSGPNESLILRHISKEMPYFPTEDLTNINYQNRNLNHSCAWYPTFTDIQIHNDYWQEFQNMNITYYIFGAYLDNRPTVVSDQPMVRLLTMMNFIATKTEDYPTTYCQLWYKEQAAPIIMPAKDLHTIWYYAWGHSSKDNHAHLISCPLPREHIDWIPQTVSLVSSPCHKASNNVRVAYLPLKANEVKQGFAVCVKGLDYPYADMSHRLVEYIETMRSLGAAKIVMYNLQVHANTTKVLNYYEKTGFLEYRPFSLSTKVGNLHEYRHMEMEINGNSYIKHEVIPYNDCLYRNMYLYDYVAVVDTDEILMPLGSFSNWYDLMAFAETITEGDCKKFASYCFRCIYFPRYLEKPRYTNEFPEYFYMLQHVQRVRDHIRPDFATKCLHNTDHVIATHNHFSLHWSGSVCASHSFNATHAQLQHYREPLVQTTLDDPVIDRSLWRFKDEIVERSLKVFEELHYFEKD